MRMLEVPIINRRFAIPEDCDGKIIITNKQSKVTAVQILKFLEYIGTATKEDVKELWMVNADVIEMRLISI